MKNSSSKLAPSNLECDMSNGSLLFNEFKQLNSKCKTWLIYFITYNGSNIQPLI